MKILILLVASFAIAAKAYPAGMYQNRFLTLASNFKASKGPQICQKYWNLIDRESLFTVGQMSKRILYLPQSKNEKSVLLLTIHFCVIE